jgi:hypothetical protein
MNAKLPIRHAGNLLSRHPGGGKGMDSLYDLGDAIASS